MENGTGVVEEIHVGEVIAGDDRIPELKLEERLDGVGVHGRKESEGNEVFEEAIEPSLDDGNEGTDELKPESDAAPAASTNDIGESDSDFYAAEGNSSLVDEGETVENDVEESDEGRDGEGESPEKVGESLAEGNSSLVDKGETIENAVEESDKGRNGEGESTDKVDESLAGYIDEGFVAQSNDNDDMTSEGVLIVDERSLNQEADSGFYAAEGNSNLVDEGEMVENSVEESDKGRSGEGETTEKVEELLAAGIEEGSVAHSNDNDDMTSERVLIVDERSLNQDADLASISSDVAVESPSEGLEAEPLTIEETKAVVGHDNVVEKFIVEEKLGNKDAEEIGEDAAAAHPPEDVEDVTANGDVNHSNGDASAGISSEEQMGNDTDALQSSDVTVGNSPYLSEGHAIEGRNTEERENSQASRKTAMKPAENSVSSSGKSAPPARPAGLGRAAPLLEPSPRAATHQPRANGQVSQVQSSLVEDTTSGEVEEGDEIREKLQMIRVKFLRLAYRLGQTPHNVVVAQVLYRLGLAEQLRARNGGRVGAFSFDRASTMAEQLEATGREPLDFSCTIMVLGKTGVGKSATINSIFDEVKFSTDAFLLGTKKVQDVVGTVQGIKVRIIDTPGLLPSCVDQHRNEKILHSVKRFIKKSPPDIVLYLDRLDMPSRDFGDMPLLRTITEIFGPSIWFNAIVVLTHAASAPPEGPNGTASTYDMFVTQRSHAVQQAIRQAAGDMRLMNPVSLVENHSACRTNRAGQRVLPNGQVWKPHLLLLSFASKILAEANTLLKLQDTPPGKPFTTRSRAPSLPLLLSSLLQSRPQLKLPEEQFGADDDDAVDDDLDESSESDDESEYDELPPFKPLTKAQLSKLSKAQKKAYYDELEYREKLFMKKQLKEEKRRRKMMKKMEAAASKEMPGEYNSENVDEEESGGAVSSLPVPMPDLPLPASFDSDNPTHRYRHLDTSNQWLVRPSLDSNGWDHDVGYEGVNVERMFVVKDKIPVSFSGQISKDKKEANLQMEVASSIKHGEGKGKATTLGFDMQSVGKDMAYTLRSETRFSNYRHNKATAGLSATVLGDAISAGVKLEDKLIVNKQFRVVMSGGAMAGQGDAAYGGSLEATFRDKDYPLGRFLSTLGLSLMDWHGEIALGGNIQTQIPVGRATNLVARANLNNRGSGQVSLRMSSSEQLQLALIGLLPIIRKLIGQYQEHPFGQ